MKKETILVGVVCLVAPLIRIVLYSLELEFRRLEPAGVCGFGPLRGSGEFLVRQASWPLFRSVDTVGALRRVLAIPEG